MVTHIFTLVTVSNAVYVGLKVLVVAEDLVVNDMSVAIVLCELV